MRCLIISTNALGDTYLSCSAIEPLKNAFPGIKIDVVAGRSAELFLPGLDIDEIYYLESKTVKNIRSLFEKIKNIKYDLAFCFFPGLVNTYFFLRADSKKKSGFINFIKRNEWHDKKQKLAVKGNGNEELFWTPDMNFLDRIRIALNGAGIPAGRLSKPKFNFEASINEEDFILFHPFSRAGNKKVNSDLILQILEAINASAGLPVFILGSSSDMADDLLKDPVKKLNFLTDLPLNKLLEYIVSCKLYIGVDSFPLHIADAYDKDILGLFTVTNPRNVFQKQRDFVSLASPFIKEEISKKIKEALTGL